MKRLPVILATTVATMLTLGNLSAVNAEPVDPTVEAIATILSAAEISELAANDGFHHKRTINNPMYPSPLTEEAWTDGLSDQAAVRVSYGYSQRTYQVFNGSTRVEKPGPDDMLAWSQLYPESKADRRVMELLPNGTKYTTGAVPGYPQPYWGFTPDQIKNSLGGLPWKAARNLAYCGRTEGIVTTTCSGTVDTISGEQKEWHFDVVNTYKEGEEPWPSTVYAKTNSMGQIVLIESYYEKSGVKITSTGNYSWYKEIPTPKIKKSNSVDSRLFTQAAAISDTKSFAKDFRQNIKDILAKAGKPINVKNVRWAYNRLDYIAPIADYTSQWFSESYFETGSRSYELGITGSDEITRSSYYALVTVKAGKLHTSYSYTPTLGSEISSTTPRTRVNF